MHDLKSDLKKKKEKEKKNAELLLNPTTYKQTKKSQMSLNSRSFFLYFVPYIQKCFHAHVLIYKYFSFILAQADNKQLD